MSALVDLPDTVLPTSGPPVPVRCLNHLKLEEQWLFSKTVLDCQGGREAFIILSVTTHRDLAVFNSKDLRTLLELPRSLMLLVSLPLVNRSERRGQTKSDPNDPHKSLSVL